jgi:uracil-DNA glycosylase
VEIVVSRTEQIQVLLKEIRECKIACKEVKVKRTPLVYSAEDPKVMIVSEVPPFDAWNNGLGDEWASGTLSIPEGTRYTSATLLKWLSTPERPMTGEDAEKLFFWIQRSNCCLQECTKDKPPKEVINRVYPRCSKEYIERAIDIVKPRVILSLGGHASWWFNPGKALKDVVGNEKYTKYRGYDYFALAHPSPQSFWPGKYPELHKRSLELVKPIISKLLREL